MADVALASGVILTNWKAGQPLSGISLQANSGGIVLFRNTGPQDWTVTMFVSVEFLPQFPTTWQPPSGEKWVAADVISGFSINNGESYTKEAALVTFDPADLDLGPFTPATVVHGRP